jgi:hypothetical protein
MVTSKQVHAAPSASRHEELTAPNLQVGPTSGPIDDCGCQTGRAWSTRALTVLVPIALARGIIRWSPRSLAGGLGFAALGSFSAGAIGKAVGITRAQRMRSEMR